MNFKPGTRVNEIGTNNGFGDTAGRKAHGSTKTIIKKAKRLIRVIQSTIKVDNWPTPTHLPLVSEPTFLFIITPPYSGSTALTQVLNSAHHSTLLQKRGEGQWLVPGMCQADRWNPDKYIDWKSVKAVWSSKIRFIEEHVGKINVVSRKALRTSLEPTGFSRLFRSIKSLLLTETLTQAVQAFFIASMTEKINPTMSD